MNIFFLRLFLINQVIWQFLLLLIKFIKLEVRYQWNRFSRILTKRKHNKFAKEFMKHQRKFPKKWNTV